MHWGRRAWGCWQHHPFTTSCGQSTLSTTTSIHCTDHTGYYYVFTLTCPASHVFTFSLSHSLILWSIPLSSIHSQLYVITYTYVQSKREKEEGKIVGGWRRYGIIPVFSFPFWGFPPFYLLKMLFIAHPQGSYILTKPRPVDQLSSLLEQYRSSTCDAVEQFFHLHGQSQACAMCLILAAGPNREVSIWLPSKLWTKNVDLHV